MRYRVLQDFTGLTRRFSAGEEINGSDVDGALTAEDWVECGRLEYVSPTWADPVAHDEDLPPIDAEMSAALGDAAIGGT